MVNDQIEDPFEDVDNANDYALNYTYTYYYSLIFGIIRCLICMGSVAANFFLIYSISKFKKLKTKTNSFIFHFAISNLCYNLFMPMFVLMELFVHLRSFIIVNCIIFHIESTFLCLSFLFASGLALDWAFNTFTIFVDGPLHGIFKNLKLILYLIGFSQFLFTFGSCFGHLYRFGHIALLSTFYILLGLTIIVNICRFKFKIPQNKTQHLYALNTTNLIMFSWCPCFLYHLLFIFLPFDSKYLYLIYYSDFIPEIIAFSNPILTVFMLGKWNKHFKVCYDIVFKKSVRDYVQDDLEESVEEDTEFNSPSSQEKRETEEIITYNNLF